MNPYHHLLVAVALDELGERVLSRAKTLAAAFDARLSIVHVVEYIPLETGEALMAAPPDLSAQLAAQADQQLSERCAQLGIGDCERHIVSGGVSAEVHRCAAEIGADLIVVGHHPRHGLAALFSHTEEDIVQRAHCDVIALHLG